MCRRFTGPAQDTPSHVPVLTREDFPGRKLTDSLVIHLFLCLIALCSLSCLGMDGIWNPVVACGMTDPQDMATCFGDTKTNNKCKNAISQKSRKDFLSRGASGVAASG
jgi:hypothetical protein